MIAETPMVLSLPPDALVDLHLHTRESDGEWTPEALVAHLADHGFRVVAVCDHDTMRAVPRVRALAEQRGMVVVPGIEVTTWWGDRECHVLVYGIDLTSPRGQRFVAFLERLERQLREAAERGIAVLTAHGYALPSLEAVVDGRPLRPVHVLQAAIRDGHATNLATAHELTKRYGEPMRVGVPIEEAVAIAHEAGGLCVLAHPGRADIGGPFSLEQLAALLDAVPLDGIEAHYRSHTDEQVRQYRMFATARGLLVSAGSDSHAPGVPVDPLPYQARWIATLLGRLGIGVEQYGGPSWEPAAAAAPPERVEAGAQPATAVR